MLAHRQRHTHGTVFTLRTLWSSFSLATATATATARTRAALHTSTPRCTADTQRHGSVSSHKQRIKGKHFIDFVRFTAKGGDGGDGCVSFHREKYLPKGPPNGGNGGRGGDVILRSSVDASTLKYLGTTCNGKRGQNGLGGGRHGMTGDHCVIEVPVGTVLRQVVREVKHHDEDEDEDALLQKERKNRWVYYPRTEPMHRGEEEEKFEEFEEEEEQQAEEEEEEEEVLTQKMKTKAAARARSCKKDFFKQAQRAMDQEDKYLRWKARKEESNIMMEVDFSAPDQEVVLCRGGTGGYGNPYFLTNDNRSPKFATRGRKGEVRAFEMELKTIADVGLVGLPNAGKSTLLGAISNAHPKQASYAFTTLHPYVGTVDYADSYQLTVADIPGLIQGAHKNIGLGHAFLRHVERAKMLVYVIDLGGVAPWEDLRVLQYELEAYHTGLTQRPSLIIANKADKVALAKENLVRLQREAPSMPVVPVSALYEKNILKLTSVLRTKVEELRRKETQTLQRIDSDV